MFNLAVDIGNTLAKIAVFKNNDLIEAKQYEQVKVGDVEEITRKYDLSQVIISSVKQNHEAWQTLLADKFKVIQFNGLVKAGINNHYKTPQTLGADRWAAVIGAHHLYPTQNNIIIGGGTCITYDFVDTGANYFGGSISPGLNMRYKAVNHFTAALPLLNADENFGAGYGDDTASAIQSGVQNGIKYELQGFISEYVKQGAGYNIILHGGDSIFFDTLYDIL